MAAREIVTPAIRLVMTRKAALTRRALFRATTITKSRAVEDVIQDNWVAESEIIERSAGKCANGSGIAQCWFSSRIGRQVSVVDLRPTHTVSAAEEGSSPFARTKSGSASPPQSPDST